MLTPEEIQSREFLVSLRGYDKDQVHAFLDEVAASVAQLRAEVGDGAPADAQTADQRPAVPAQSAGAEAAHSPFAAIAAETQQILEAAQAAGEEMRARAQAEADRTRDELVSAAEAEMADLRAQATAVRREIDVLRLRREEMSDQLRQARDTAELALMDLQVEDAVAEDPVAEDAVAEHAVAEHAVVEEAVVEEAVVEDAVVEDADERLVPQGTAVEDVAQDPTEDDGLVTANLFSSDAGATGGNRDAENVRE